MKFPSVVITIALLLSALTGCPRVQDPRTRPLRVHAAASLRDVLAEVLGEWKETGGVPVEVHHAGSGTLAGQIVAAGAADLFLPAGPAPMDRVQHAGLLLEGTRRPLLGNTLVVVAPSGTPSTLEGPADLTAAGVRRIAMAHPAPGYRPPPTQAAATAVAPAPRPEKFCGEWRFDDKMRLRCFVFPRVCVKYRVKCSRCAAGDNQPL